MPMARLLVDRHRAEVPHDRDALLSLPGVGPYVADAVRVLAFDETGVFIDTNTVRVAGRYFGFSTHAESRRRRPVREAIARLIDQGHSRESNLALLDLAALLCRPGRPFCDQCPVVDHCRYARAAQRLAGSGPVLTEESAAGIANSSHTRPPQGKSRRGPRAPRG